LLTLNYKHILNPKVFLSIYSGIVCFNITINAAMKHFEINSLCVASTSCYSCWGSLPKNLITATPLTI